MTSSVQLQLEGGHDGVLLQTRQPANMYYQCSKTRIQDSRAQCQ